MWAAAPRAPLPVARVSTLHSAAAGAARALSQVEAGRVRQRPAAIVFDKDGTLIDAHATWAPVLRRVQRRGFPGPEGGVLLELLGLDDASGRFHGGAPFMIETNATCSALLDERGFDGGAFYRLLNEDLDGGRALQVVSLCATMLELFAECRALGLRVAVLTADDRCNTESFLQREGLSVDAMVCGDDGRGCKPSREPLDALARDLALPVETLVMCGDSVHDVGSGVDARSWSVGVLTGVGTAATLSHADAVVDSVLDVPKLVEGWQRRC